MTLSDLYDIARLVWLGWTILGLGISSGAVLSAHLDARAARRNGGTALYAQTRRSAEILTLVAQIIFFIVACAFIAAPAPPLNTPAGEAGVFRVWLTAIAVMALTIKSGIVFVNGSRIQRMLVAGPG